MAKPLKYKSMPFGKRARNLFAFLLGELLSIWIVAAAAVILLPTIVPAQFNWSGTALSSGFSFTLIIIALLFSIIPIAILIIALFRFKIVNDYPYLLNMPSFYANAKRIAPSRRSYWVNQYFKILLVGGVYISAILLILVLEIYAAASKNYLNGFLSIIAPIVAIVAVAVLVLLLLKNLYSKMEVEASTRKRNK